MIRDSSRWLKANALGLVTLLCVVLAVAVAWGTTRADISTTSAHVVDLRSDARVATSERAAMRSDLRVVETKQQATIDRLERVVDRLEAVTRAMKRGP